MSDNPLRQHINDLATPINPAPVVDDRTYSQLLEDRAVARRAAQANAQALKTSQMQLAHTQPVADAARAYCAEVKRGAGVARITAARRALRAAHEATTPSEVPSSHVIVERTELERLQAIAIAADDLLATPIPNPVSGRQLMDLARPLRVAVRGA